MKITFTTFPQLETDRLLLRQMTEADENEVFFLRTDDEVMKYIKRPRPSTVQEAREWIVKINEAIAKKESLVWAITLKGSNQQIGTLLLWKFRLEDCRAEVGYVLHPAHHQKGIMHEALCAVLNYAFNSMGFHSIEALIDPVNDASRKLLEKNNFVREGYFKEDFFFEGEFLDTAVYSLIGRNWKPLK